MTAIVTVGSVAVGGLAGCDKKQAESQTAALKLDAPARGAATPKVDVLAFLDYECPYSRGQAKELLAMADKHKDKVRVRFLNLPLDVHPNAVTAAKGAVAASKQGKFFEFYGHMMDAKSVDRASVLAWAKQAGLDAARFEKDLDSPEVAKIVGRDVAVAKALGVSGTPSFVVNGNLLQGVQSADVWDKKIGEESQRADTLLQSGTRPEELTRALVAAANPKGAADYLRYVVDGQPAPEAPVPAKVPRASGVASASIAPAGGAGGAVQVGEPVQIGQESGDGNTVWRVAVRPDDPALGPASAPVTVVVFEDMECPYCAKLKPVLDKLRDQYKDKLRVVFKHNPLPFHKNAELAAEALEAARQQGKFWEMHDLLLASQDKLDQASLGEHAAKLGLDKGRFDTALAARGGKERIDADMEQAAALGARGTPNLFINGKKLVGAKEEAVLVAAIDEAQKAAAELVAKGTPADGVYDAITGTGKLLDSLASDAKPIDLPKTAATRGPIGAAVHIVTFQDFQCPFSARLDPHIAEIEKEFPGRVKVSWVDFPLRDIHPLAQKYAEAGQEALKQGKFWEFHQAVMADNSKLSDEALLASAKKAGLNVKALQDALQAKTHAAAVDAHRTLGEGLGVKGTPSVFINGHQFVPQSGFSANTFRSAVRRLLGTR